MTTFEIELTIEGPYLTQSSAAGEYGVDAPMARTVKRDGTEEKRLAYVPASALKGKLKQAWQEIGLGDAEKLLGAKSGNQQEPGPWEPLPAQLHFGDLLLEEGRAASKLRHRIRIDRERGSVDEGALLVLESPFASGAHAIFRGSVRLMGSEEPGQVREWLERGLRWTPSLGAERTTGFGRILGVKVAAGKAVSREETSGGVTGSFQFALKPAGPFCVSMQRLSGNLFESNTEIPGGAIKGMVARMLLMEAGNGGYRVDAELGTMGTKLEKYRNLCAEFERVRFTHALPAKEGTKERPVRVPLSLVTAGEKLYDAADRDKPFLVGGEAPEFDIDWKKTPYGVKQFGWETIETELRVRTAIDPGKLRASDEQLFAYEMVNPDGFEWLGTADVSQVMDEKVRAAVTSELAALFRSGLYGLGKSKVAVRVECPVEFVPKLLPRGRSNSQAAPRLEAIDGEWRVTLMTPALLCDPTSLTRSSGNGTELLEAYRKSWLEISGKTLHLKRFFARQTLAGSYYLYSRFRNGDCLPWLLTDAGSVFVLEAAKDQKEQDVANFISTAWTGGLKLPMWAKEKDGTPWDWETCPFVRENGYGEVAVNLDIKNVALPEEGVTDVDAI